MSEKLVSLVLNEAEVKSLLNILDLVVRSQGLRVLPDVGMVLGKLNAATDKP